MTWYHPALAQRALDEGDSEIARLKSELAQTQAKLGMRNSDLAEAVRLLDALLGLELDSGGEALVFIERYRAAVSSQQGGGE